jgi:hypothetical protein
MVGERVVEEEQAKSKILSLFEADISSKKIKTFYNGVVGVLEERKRQDRIIQEEKIFIIHPLSSFRFAVKQWKGYGGDKAINLMIFCSFCLSSSAGHHSSVFGKIYP